MKIVNNNTSPNFFVAVAIFVVVTVLTATNNVRTVHGEGHTGTCFPEGDPCTALGGECCDELECIADINVATFSADLSCGPAFDSCSVCGDGMVVGNPDDDAQLPLPGFTFTCGQLEMAGMLGVFDPSLCGFVPALIGDVCGCMVGEADAPTDAPVDMGMPTDMGGGDMPTDEPSMMMVMTESMIPSDEPSMVPSGGMVDPTMSAAPSVAPVDTTQAPSAAVRQQSITVAGAVVAVLGGAILSMSL